MEEAAPTHPYIVMLYGIKPSNTDTENPEHVVQQQVGNLIRQWLRVRPDGTDVVWVLGSMALSMRSLTLSLWPLKD